jgi:hypothetical protein
MFMLGLQHPALFLVNQKAEKFPFPLFFKLIILSYFFTTLRVVTRP